MLLRLAFPACGTIINERESGTCISIPRLRQWSRAALRASDRRRSRRCVQREPGSPYSTSTRRRVKGRLCKPVLFSAAATFCRTRGHPGRYHSARYFPDAGDGARYPADAGGAGQDGPVSPTLGSCGRVCEHGAGVRSQRLSQRRDHPAGRRDPDATALIADWCVRGPVFAVARAAHARLRDGEVHAR